VRTLGGLSVPYPMVSVVLVYFSKNRCNSRSYGGRSNMKKLKYERMRIGVLGE